MFAGYLNLETSNTSWLTLPLCLRALLLNFRFLPLFWLLWKTIPPPSFSFLSILWITTALWNLFGWGRTNVYQQQSELLRAKCWSIEEICFVGENIVVVHSSRSVFPWKWPEETDPFNFVTQGSWRISFNYYTYIDSSAAYNFGHVTNVYYTIIFESWFHEGCGLHFDIHFHRKAHDFLEVYCYLSIIMQSGLMFTFDWATKIYQCEIKTISISNVGHCQLVVVIDHFIARWIFLVNELNHGD